MIKINLIPGQTQKTQVNVLGLNLADINLKYLIPAFFLWYFHDMEAITSFIKGDEITIVQEEVKKLNDVKKKLKRKASGQKDIQIQIDAFKRQEDVLSQRLNVVKTILATRKNPIQILLYISKNVPSDLWINSLELKGDKFILRGESTSYKSIGIFIENLKSAVFFASDLRLVGSKTKTNKGTNIRTEEFEIAAKVVRFD